MFGISFVFRLSQTYGLKQPFILTHGFCESGIWTGLRKELFSSWSRLLLGCGMHWSEGFKMSLLTCLAFEKDDWKAGNINWSSNMRPLQLNAFRITEVFAQWLDFTRVRTYCTIRVVYDKILSFFLIEPVKSSSAMNTAFYWLQVSQTYNPDS